MPNTQIQTRAEVMKRRLEALATVIVQADPQARGQRFYDAIEGAKRLVRRLTEAEEAVKRLIPFAETALEYYRGPDGKDDTKTEALRAAAKVLKASRRDDANA